MPRTQHYCLAHATYICSAVARFNAARDSLPRLASEGRHFVTGDGMQGEGMREHDIICLSSLAFFVGGMAP